MYTLKNSIQKLCKLYGIYPSKSKGQNFLLDEGTLRRMVDAAEVTQDDTVLEVGPGFGTLTALLAEKAKRVIAVELDTKLVEVLRAQLIGYNNVQIVQGDILKNQELRIMNQEYKIVANLPYNISSYFLRKFLTLPFSPSLAPRGLGAPSPVPPKADRVDKGEGYKKNPSLSPLSLDLEGSRPRWRERGRGEGEAILTKPSLMVLLLQKEVAERICAKPGEMSILSFSVRFYAEPKIIEYVSRENFWPMPKVDSAIIKIIPYKKEKIDFLLKKSTVDEKGLLSIVKWGFASRRKQLHNNISSGLYSTLHRKATSEEMNSIFQQSKIHPQMRAQDLSIHDWLNLAKAINEI